VPAPRPAQRSWSARRAILEDFRLFEHLETACATWYWLFESIESSPALVSIAHFRRNGAQPRESCSGSSQRIFSPRLFWAPLAADKHFRRPRSRSYRLDFAGVNLLGDDMEFRLSYACKRKSSAPEFPTGSSSRRRSSSSFRFIVAPVVNIQRITMTAIGCHRRTSPTSQIVGELCTPSRLSGQTFLEVWGGMGNAIASNAIRGQIAT